MKLIADLFHTSPIIEVRLCKPNGKQSEIYKALIDTGTYYNYALEAIFGEEEIETTGQLLKGMKFGNILHEGLEHKCMINIPALSQKVAFDFFFVKAIDLIDPFQVILGTKFLVDFDFSFNVERGKFSLERLG